MEIDGARVLVAGATGALGARLCAALAGRGASLAVAGRDAQRLHELTRTLDARTPYRAAEAYDLDAFAALPGWARTELGGLDAVICTVGVAAFGRCEEVGDEVAEHLMTVNALAPMAVLRAAVPELGQGGAIGAVTGVLVERPQRGIADYGAAKAALSSWLTAVRAEQRSRGVQVLEARLPHLDTGFAERAVTGDPPPLPRAVACDEAVQAIVDAVAHGETVLRPAASGGFGAESADD